MRNRRSNAHLITWVLVGSLFGTTAHAQSTHLIRGLDFFYLPDTLYMLAGDSVHFQTQGIHDMVQTDSASWAANQAITNGGFVTEIGVDTTFVIDTAGTYYFVCSPHGFVGMKGVLLVDSLLPTSIPQRTSAEYVVVHPNPSTGVIHFAPPMGATLFEVYTDGGMLMKRGEFASRHDQALDLRDLPDGAYLVRLLDPEGNMVANGRFILAKE